MTDSKKNLKIWNALSLQMVRLNIWICKIQTWTVCVSLNERPINIPNLHHWMTYTRHKFKHCYEFSEEW